MSVRKRRWKGKAGEVKEAWAVDYVDGQGKRRLKTYAKKKDADDFHATSRVEVAAGIHVADSATITIEAAGKNWLRSGAEQNLERTTLDQRRQHFQLHIVPFIGSVKLNKVTVPFLRAFQDMLRNADRSPAMVKRVTVSLGSILADAQGRGLVIRNAVHEMARSRTGKTTEKRHSGKLQVGVDIPTPGEVGALLKAAEGRYRPLLVTAVFSGLRISELLGLRWQDVDLDAGKLRVRQRANIYQDMGAPKSEAGQREVPLPPMVVNTLKQWKLACPKGKAGLVFPDAEGNVDTHGRAKIYGLWPAWVAAGVTVPGKDRKGEPEPKPKYTGFHSLRHWFASWCINRKSDGGLELSPKAVQTRMGHGSIAVTFDTYGHLFPATDEQKELEAAEAKLLSVMSQ
jgi:integrase